MPGRWFVCHRDNRQITAFVKGATAAAAGAIGGATVVLTRGAVVDWKTAILAVIALVVLWRYKVKESWIVLRVQSADSCRTHSADATSYGSRPLVAG